MWVVGVGNLRSLVGLWALRTGSAKSHDTCGLVTDLWARVFAHYMYTPLVSCSLFALEGITQMMGSLVLWASVGRSCRGTRAMFLTLYKYKLRTEQHCGV